MAENEQGLAMSAEARRWIGTPYLHQAALKSVGCDCIGLIRGVCRDAFGFEPEKTPFYRKDWYLQDKGNLKAALERYFKRIPEIELGAIACFELQNGASHAAIITRVEPNMTRITHAYSGRGVVETPIPQKWHEHMCLFTFSIAK